LDERGFYLPEGADGVVTIATGKTVLFACPGNTNSFNNTNVGIRTALATCVSGTTFSSNLYEPCPPNTPFYVFFQQISVLNFLNMLHILLFPLFKMLFIS
jgi:hypothetical protein